MCNVYAREKIQIQKRGITTQTNVLLSLWMANGRMPSQMEWHTKLRKIAQDCRETMWKNTRVRLEIPRMATQNREKSKRECLKSCAQ